MIVDASTKGIERMMYGEAPTRHRVRGNGPRITYNSPINRDRPSRDISRRSEPRSARQSREDFILQSREEADEVLERMHDIVDQFDVVTVADLNEMIGFKSSHVDNKWGWDDLRGSEVRQIREGYLLMIPSPSPIN